MPTFIVLGTFDQQPNAVALSSIQGDAKKLMKEIGGGKVVKLWLTTGGYDLVAQVEADDADKAITFLIAFSSLGRVRVQTLTAAAGVDGIVKQANKAKTNVNDAKTNVGDNG